MSDPRFQRVGAVSNTQVGRDFEEVARLYFEQTGISLQPRFPVLIGHAIKKVHQFDLGSHDPPMLVECKSYTWTETGNSPSAKIRALNEAMLHFAVAPQHFKKVLFLLKHMRKNVSLATHFVKNQGHLIGPDIEVWEFDIELKIAARIF